ncbi:MAG: hypothetical protein ACRDUA_20555, partial [Micromonosporaceae bacterium]
VEVLTGDDTVTKTATTYRLMRGMHGDRLPDGATRTVTVTDSRGGTVTDHNRFAGQVRETTVRDGSGGGLVSMTIDTGWLGTVTATRGTNTARLTGTQASSTYVPTPVTTRETRTTTSFDSLGFPVEVSDLGDVATSSDDLCTITTYVRDGSSGLILDRPRRTETVSTSCAATPTRPDDVVSDQRMYYDGAASSLTPPTEGNLTKVDELATWGTGPAYVTTATSSYDAYGRETSATDAADRTTATGYTPASNAHPTEVTTTNPAGHVSTSELNRFWGTPDAVVDPNSRRTDVSHDALGRITSVWAPGRSKAAGDTPQTKYAYGLRSTAPSYVTTQTMIHDGTYLTSHQLFDALLRPRQTQTPAAGDDGGRVVTETWYDSRGLAVEQGGPYYNTAAPSTSLVQVLDAQNPALTKTSYDGAARPVLERFLSQSVEKWRT